MTKANIHTRQYTERVEHEATECRPQRVAGFHDWLVFIRDGTPRGLSTKPRDATHTAGQVFMTGRCSYEAVHQEG